MKFLGFKEFCDMLALVIFMDELISQPLVCPIHLSIRRGFCGKTHHYDINGDNNETCNKSSYEK